MCTLYTVLKAEVAIVTICYEGPVLKPRAERFRHGVLKAPDKQRVD